MKRVAWLMAISALGCAPVEVLLVDLPDGGAVCTSNADCGGADTFCDRSDRSQARCAEVGVCKQRPVFACDEYHLVCGCDGVTYLSACWAWVQGVSVAEEHECVDFRSRCDPGHPCPAHADCARVTASCQSRVEGICFSAPARCPPTAPSVRPCAPDSHCLDVCMAINTGTVFSFDPSCP